MGTDGRLGGLLIGIFGCGRCFCQRAVGLAALWVVAPPLPAQPRCAQASVTRAGARRPRARPFGAYCWAMTGQPRNGYGNQGQGLLGLAGLAGDYSPKRRRAQPCTTDA